MMRKIYLLITLLFAFSVATFAQSGMGELRGKVTDNVTKEGVAFAFIVLEQNGVQVAQNQSDFNGDYILKPLNPGKYDLRIKMVGYNDRVISGVVVTANKQSYVNPEITPVAVQTEVVEVTTYRKPLIEQDQTVTTTTLTSEELVKLPVRDINSAVSTSAGVYQADNGGEINVRGGRSDANEVYVDGVKVRGSTAVPQASIDQLSIITGGVPAQFGDATGGIISITTKGPSRTLAGGIEAVTSEFLDGYGYNLISGNISGPVYTKNKGTNEAKPVVGFFVAAEMESRRDNDPSAAPVYEAKSDYLKNLQENPLVRDVPDFGTVVNGEYTHKSDLKKVKAQDGNNARTISLNSRLDFQLTPNSTLAFGLRAANEYSRVYSRLNMLFNADKNAEFTRNYYSFYLRYSQRFTNSEKENALLKNAYYSLQLDYSKSKDVQQDPDLKDKIFEYGYYGKYTLTRTDPFIGTAAVLGGNDTIFLSDGTEIHYARTGTYGFRDDAVTFEPGTSNPYLSNYTSQYYEYLEGEQPNNLVEIVNNRGLRNGDPIAQVYGGLFNMPGAINNNYLLRDRDQYRFSANASADIKNHSIQIGFELEQRVEAQYTIAPRGLWTVMSGLANASNTLGIDPGADHSIMKDDGTDSLTLADTLFYVRGDTLMLERFNTDGGYFAQHVREKLGLQNSDFVDIDSYDPEVYSLDMFSAQELVNDASLVNYFGYDYTGKRDRKKYNFDDFFNDSLNRPVDAFRPVYIAGYIQDKFTFRDIIFNLGLRVDRYDANQPVMIDKYSLYKTRSKGEVAGTLNQSNGGAHPGNIGDDYVVYVDNPTDPTEILGYRSGNIFYDAQGNITDDPRSIAASQGITPYISEDAITDENGSRTPTLNSKSFKDYEPQIQVMPRIAFSFPISDEANFFANYDVLTQRPRISNASTNAIISNPINYLKLSTRQSLTIANPELRPEKRINYQFGFKQKVSQTSALTLNVFYSEIKDNFQIVNVENAYPVNYQSFENVDFGTIKGLTVTYDLRRTNNIQINAAYTLQFADGTGSTSTTAQNLLQSGEGQIRIPLPLEYDQRHTIVTTVDYRYASGTAYNGPAGMRKVLENAGLNMIFRAGSGTPYSRIDVSQVQNVLDAQDTRFRKLIGEINGSRLPWEFNVDLRLDKDFMFTSKSENGKGNDSYLNVYLLVQNVFNTLRVADVYPATGSPNDDGFLTSAQAQSELASKADVNSYIDLYNIYLNTPANYRSPRIIRVGASYNF